MTFYSWWNLCRSKSRIMMDQSNDTRKFRVMACSLPWVNHRFHHCRRIQKSPFSFGTIWGLHEGNPVIYPANTQQTIFYERRQMRPCMNDAATKIPWRTTRFPSTCKWRANTITEFDLGIGINWRIPIGGRSHPCSSPILSKYPIRSTNHDHGGVCSITTLTLQDLITIIMIASLK